MYALTDFSQCPLSNRHGSYSGNAGGKRGIVFQDADWIVKYPKITRSMRGDKLPSYTSSPLSEFLGSHVFSILGVDVHDTLLGVDKGKLVVACRDFRPDNAILKEFRSVKNAMTPELNDRFDLEIAESATGDRVSVEETLFHLAYNPVCDIPGINRRFAEMIVVDAIIDNTDRNNGNWGLLSVGGRNELAPVFDNGNAFSNKVDDEHLDTDPDVMLAKWLGGRSIYEMGGHQLSNRNLFAADIPQLAESAERILGRFEDKHDEIVDLIMSLPEHEGDLAVCSEKRKEAYLAGMDVRARWIAEDFGLDVSLSAGN